jgi:hypothetical protein
MEEHDLFLQSAPNVAGVMRRDEWTRNPALRKQACLQSPVELNTHNPMGSLAASHMIIRSCDAKKNGEREQPWKNGPSRVRAKPDDSVLRATAGVWSAGNLIRAMVIFESDFSGLGCNASLARALAGAIHRHPVPTTAVLLGLRYAHH